LHHRPPYGKWLSAEIAPQRCKEQAGPRDFDCEKYVRADAVRFKFLFVFPAKAGTPLPLRRQKKSGVPAFAGKTSILPIELSAYSS
jgi:hypothetical protein